MKVKITKTSDGYVMRSQEMGKMAFSKQRDILTGIAARQGWSVVSKWS